MDIVYIQNLDDIKTLICLGKRKGELLDYFIVSFNSPDYEYFIKF